VDVRVLRKPFPSPDVLEDHTNSFRLSSKLLKPDEMRALACREKAARRKRDAVAWGEHGVFLQRKKNDGWRFLIR
jgi:predicted nucleotide-binding protein